MTYKVEVISQTNATILIIISLALFLVSAGTLLPPEGIQNAGWAILFAATGVLIVYISWRVFVTGRTEWTINDNEIKIQWTKKIFLADCSDTTIKWSEIDDISRGVDPHYYILKIKLVSGGKIKYIHSVMTTRDDFQQMLQQLYQTLKDKKKLKPAGVQLK